MNVFMSCDFISHSSLEVKVEAKAIFPDNKIK